MTNFIFCGFLCSKISNDVIFHNFVLVQYDCKFPMFAPSAPQAQPLNPIMLEHMRLAKFALIGLWVVLPVRIVILGFMDGLGVFLRRKIVETIFFDFFIFSFRCQGMCYLLILSFFFSCLSVTLLLKDDPQMKRCAICLGIRPIRL